MHHSVVYSAGRTEQHRRIDTIDVAYCISRLIYTRTVHHRVDCGAPTTLRRRIKFQSAICAVAAILQHFHEFIFDVPVGHSHMDSFRCVAYHRLRNIFHVRHPAFRRKNTNHKQHWGAREEHTGRIQWQHIKQYRRFTQRQHGLCHHQHNCTERETTLKNVQLECMMRPQSMIQEGGRDLGRDIVIYFFLFLFQHMYKASRCLISGFFFRRTTNQWKFKVGFAFFIHSFLVYLRTGAKFSIRM